MFVERVIQRLHLQSTITLQLNPFARRKMAFLQTAQLHDTNSTLKQQTANQADKRDCLFNFLLENPAPEPPPPKQQMAFNTAAKSLQSGDCDDRYLALDHCL
jgi:hypothetical protein